MRIAYIGNFGPEYSTENDVRKAFEHLGHEVIKLQENESPRVLEGLYKYDYDMLLITGTWDNLEPLQVWVSIFQECAQRDIPTATLHLDTFWGKSRGGRKWWLHPMFQTAYIFTADGDYEKEWKAFGKNHIWLPPAVRYDAVHLGKFRKEYECDVAFVGSNGKGYHEDVWGYRKELVDYLRSASKRNGWTFRNPGGGEPKVDRNEDLNDFYASAKIVVGDSLCLQKQNSKYWSDRVPETTGRGGFLIMPEIHALKSYWTNCLPMYKWGNFNRLEGQIVTYLREENRRNEMRLQAQAITAKNHTYVNRVETILKEVGLSE